MTTTEQHTPAWGEPGSWITLPDGRAAQVWSAAGITHAPPGEIWLDTTRGHHIGALRWAVTADQCIHLVDLDELDTQLVSQDDLFGGAG